MSQALSQLSQALDASPTETRSPAAAMVRREPRSAAALLVEVVRFAQRLHGLAIGRWKQVAGAVLGPADDLLPPVSEGA